MRSNSCGTGCQWGSSTCFQTVRSYESFLDIQIDERSKQHMHLILTVDLSVETQGKAPVAPIISVKISWRIGEWGLIGFPFRAALKKGPNRREANKKGWKKNVEMEKGSWPDWFGTNNFEPWLAICRQTRLTALHEDFCGWIYLCVVTSPPKDYHLWFLIRTTGGISETPTGSITGNGPCAAATFLMTCCWALKTRLQGSPVVLQPASADRIWTQDPVQQELITFAPWEVLCKAHCQGLEAYNASMSTEFTSTNPMRSPKSAKSPCQMSCLSSSRQDLQRFAPQSHEDCRTLLLWLLMASMVLVWGQFGSPTSRETWWIFEDFSQEVSPEALEIEQFQHTETIQTLRVEIENEEMHAAPWSYLPHLPQSSWMQLVWAPNVVALIAVAAATCVCSWFRFGDVGCLVCFINRTPTGHTSKGRPEQQLKMTQWLYLNPSSFQVTLAFSFPLILLFGSNELKKSKCGKPIFWGSTSNFKP